MNVRNKFEILISLQNLFVRTFLKYVSNRYLGDNLNNFICEESIWMIFICASISIKLECYMFLFIENTHEWEGLISIPILSMELFKSFTLFSLKFLI